ncbi:unnamed protein product, partial [Choristocarpus tenellus]
MLIGGWGGEILWSNIGLSNLPAQAGAISPNLSLVVEGGTIQLTTYASVPVLVLSGGAVEMGAEASLDINSDLYLSGGVVDLVAGATITTKQMEWSGGTLTGGGEVKCLKLLRILGEGEKILQDGAMLVNAGLGLWESGNITSTQGAEFLNLGNFTPGAGQGSRGYWEDGNALLNFQSSANATLVGGGAWPALVYVSQTTLLNCATLCKSGGLSVST